MPPTSSGSSTTMNRSTKTTSFAHGPVCKARSIGTAKKGRDSSGQFNGNDWCVTICTRNLKFRPASGSSFSSSHSLIAHAVTKSNVAATSASSSIGAHHPSPHHHRPPLRISKQVPAHILAEHDKPLPAPEEWLFDPSLLSPLSWQSQGGQGGGLSNPGTNICFMNATLQALVYAPSFGEDLRGYGHSKNCGHHPRNTFCALCLLEQQVHMLSTCQKHMCAENRIYMYVKRLIWRQYRIGRQEDAHEFLRYFMEALAKSCIHPNRLGEEGSSPNVPLTVKVKDSVWMTTYISQQFGGWYKSTIQCHTCLYRSNKYDPFLDFAMEIAGASSLEKALARFVLPEELCQSNKYLCPVCNSKQDAVKRLVIYHAPRLLTIPLKRFGFTPGFSASKNCSRFSFPLHLDLTSCVHKEHPDDDSSKNEMSTKAASPQTQHKKRHRNPSGNGQKYHYELWAVVSHLGHSLRSGHYVTHAKAPNGMWYRYDDERVTSVGLSAVLDQKTAAYILFYSRINEPSLPPASPFSASSTSTAASDSDLMEPKFHAITRQHAETERADSGDRLIRVQVSNKGECDIVTAKFFSTGSSSSVSSASSARSSSSPSSSASSSSCCSSSSSPVVSSAFSSSSSLRSCSGLSPRVFSSISRHPYMYRKLRTRMLSLGRAGGARMRGEVATRRLREWMRIRTEEGSGGGDMPVVVVHPALDSVGALKREKPIGRRKAQEVEESKVVKKERFDVTSRLAKAMSDTTQFGCAIGYFHLCIFTSQWLFATTFAMI
eukprot:GHVS01074595.1.p1 GENE.GHVS01074595.1~~GHVS01074595.1.p1  ORF type:complete len:771 (+),score=87.06 GHVS01074595.1:164-2476(+)